MAKEDRIQRTERAGLRFERKARASVADHTRKVLNTPPIPEGLVGRIVNDVDDRIEKMKEQGWLPYEVKEGDETNAITQTTTLGSVWNKSVGAGTRGVLMVKPKEWYDEDQAVKTEKNKEVERTLQRKAEEANLASSLGHGHTMTGISIKRG